MKALALDNSSAIYLAKLGMLPKLLGMQIELLTTKEIEAETKKGVEKGYRDAFIRDDFIRNKKIKITGTKIKEEIKSKYKLKDADASIIALALEKDCLLATEDGTLQSIAKSLGAKITNAAALLYYTYEKGQLRKQQCLMLLDLLEHYGYSKELTIRVREQILEEGGKNE